MFVSGYIVWLTVICFCFYEVCGQNYSRRVLMVLTQNSSLGIEDIWNTQTGINNGNGNKETQPLDSIISEGTFRSTLVNSWTTTSPSLTTVEVTNTVGDVLWWTSFNTTGTHANLSSWMTHSNILNSSTDLVYSTEDPTFHFSSGTYDLLLAHNTSSDMAWLCVYRETTSPASSVFLITSSQKSELLDLTGVKTTYVDSIYTNEREIKDTTESSMSASYLDILLNIDINGKLTIQLSDKRDDFGFSIVNFPYLCSNIPSSPAYGLALNQDDTLQYDNIDTAGYTEMIVYDSDTMININEILACAKTSKYSIALRLYNFTIKHSMSRCPSNSLQLESTKVFETKHSGSCILSHTLDMAIPSILVRCLVITLLTSDNGFYFLFKTKGLTGKFVTGDALVVTGYWLESNLPLSLITTETGLTTAGTQLTTTVTSFATTVEGLTTTGTDLGISVTESTTNVTRLTTIGTIPSDGSTSSANFVSTDPSSSEYSTNILENKTISNAIDTTATPMSLGVSDSTTTSSPIGLQSTEQSRSEETVYVGSCVCTCTGSGYNMTSEELAGRIIQLKKEALLDRKTLNVHHRRLTSAVDERISSQYFGSIGAFILTAFVCLIFVSDSQRCWYCLLQIRRNQQLKAKKTKSFVN